ncbi:ABC transporter ATP-binding protein [Amycolatopsis sp. NPDC001319]|uniref:ABC transporter ATP-binding protein n=1 Tax=unclassified Amycolatopsis TaxID=2618356 RepID=UPI0036B8BDD2
MNTTTATRLELRDLVKRYGTQTALDEVSLVAEAGQFVVLLGPSGSGKSTLLRSVAGIERVHGGRILLGDRLVAGDTLHVPPERRELAMVFQDYALWPHLTVADNVAYPLRRKKIARPEAEKRATAMLERVGLGDYATRFPSELSGGEQQRVALGRALVGRPSLLLFDEPLSNLDADLRERVRVEIATLARESGATVVYITHDQSEAFALADQIGVLDHGRLVQYARPETVYLRPANRFVARFTGLAADLAATVARVDGEYVVLDTGERRLRARAVGDLRPGDGTRLLIRPAATRIVAHREVGEDGSLDGSVVDVAYRGRGYDHVVATAGGELTAVFDERPWPRGSEVRVVLTSDGCIADVMEQV